jgi:outer membrane protein OmpA-like peptidoglycan-associated protein
MSSLIKILIGGALTALLTYLFYGPLGFGSKCAATGAVMPEATAPVAAAPAAPAAEAPATAAAVATCQADVDKVAKSKQVNFASGNAVITDYSMPVIDALAVAAKNCTGTNIEIAGHTDQQGDDGANMKLSQARADAVVALVSKGVPKERLTAKGYGETKLLDQGTSSEALAKNRRIEFTVATAAADAAAAAPQ